MVVLKTVIDFSIYIAYMNHRFPRCKSYIRPKPMGYIIRCPTHANRVAMQLIVIPETPSPLHLPCRPLLRTHHKCSNTERRPTASITHQISRPSLPHNPQQRRDPRPLAQTYSVRHFSAADGTVLVWSFWQGGCGFVRRFWGRSVGFGWRG